MTERIVESDPLVRALNRAEARLKVSEQRLLLAVDTAQIATWELDPSNRTLVADRRCRAMHGLALDGPLELGSILQRIDPSHRSEVAKSIECLLEARGPAGFELEYPITDDGGTRWVFTRGQVLGTDNGPRVIAALLDISGRHRHEEAAKKEAELYQQMVGIVSHDLKNPVQVMLTGLGLLDESRLEEKQRTVLRRLKNATHRASRLITDLLDFTRDRLGNGIPVERRKIDLVDVVRDCISAFAFARPDGKIELEREGDTFASLDSDRMEQLVTNLLDNAFEYALDEAMIRVMVRGKADKVELLVTAHGETIAPEILEQLFEPLSPAVRERNRRRVGLGLYIVRAIAEAHGGTADISSKEQQTCFSVLLPRM